MLSHGQGIQHWELEKGFGKVQALRKTNLRSFIEAVDIYCIGSLALHHSIEAV